VRVGKFLLVNIDGTDRAKAEVAVTEMCQKLLANPVIEDFTFDLEEISASKSAP
jgi:phosphoribosylformylglycinamidine synthase